MDSRELLNRWQAGDQQAADELYQRYVRRLAGIVSGHLASHLQRRIDPDDVLQSAYRSFFRGARDGRFQFEDDADVWKLLVTITLNKTRRAVRRHSTNGRDVRNEVAPHPRTSDMTAVSMRPQPEDILNVADLMTQLCDVLGEQHGQVLQLRLEGYSQQEVAARLGVSERTVRRWLDQMRVELSKVAARA